MEYRIEHDSMGEIKVPRDCYWGASSQRSLENFRIGNEKMPQELIYALAYLKRACATVNQKLGKLDLASKDAINKACDEILAGKFDSNFPLALWQTGSGTQTNMNLNEVIANRATEILGGDFRKEKLVHPNDHVNMSQSSNDTFPTAMHMASVFEIKERLLPSLATLHEALKAKEKEFKDIIKIGRTHLQDATPLSLGQEFSGYKSMLEHSGEHIHLALDSLRELAIGGTAVGTGINAHPKFAQMVQEELELLTQTKFVSAPNKFHSLTSHDALVFASGANKALAANLMKIANDIRLLASGPRCGIGELFIPENEPGSSIMPGKVNPTQAEAVTMVVAQVFGCDTTISFAASQGNFELNTFKPVIIYNFLQQVRLLADVMDSFCIHCVRGITANTDKISENLNNSLMLVTALSPHIGYENAAKAVKLAYREKLSLKEACLRLKLLSEADFDAYVVPAHMIHPA